MRGFDTTAGTIKIVMNLQPTDILIRQSGGKETLWLSQRLIMEVCEVDDNYLKVARIRYKKEVRPCDLAKAKDFMPDSGKSWRWGKTQYGFYYCYDNIPDRKGSEFRSKLGSKEELKDRLNEVSKRVKFSFFDAIKETIKLEVNALVNNDDKNYYMYQADVVFNPQRALEMAKAKAWCIYIKNLYETAEFKKLGIQKKQDFINICTEILKDADLTGLKVSSPAYLRNKIEKFPAEGIFEQRNFLISEKYNNDNARKVGKYPLVDTETGELFMFDAHEALMFYGYMNPGGSSKDDIRSIYTDFYYDAIQDFGFEPVAYRTFCHHIGQFHNQIKTAKERHGTEYFKKQVLTYVPQKKLQYAHSLFAADGSGTINYKYYNSKKELKTMKLYVILISDVASRQIVGWAASAKGQHKESSETLETALKMAVKNCEYQTMFEIISDNHSAFTSAESKSLLNLVFNKVRTIEVGNSQANPAETEFRLFKKSLKGLSNFGSTSWNAGIEGQSNPDYFNIEDLPDYEDAILQFHDIVEKWNKAPLRDETTPQQRFKNKNPKCTDMDHRILRRLYGNHTEGDISYMRGFVKVEKTEGYHKREKFLFEIPDFWGEGSEILSKATGYKKGVKVKVIWDETGADLYTMDDKFIIHCPPAPEASSSHAESDEFSDLALGHHLKRKEKMTEKADEFTESLKSIFQELPYEHQMKTGGSKESYNENMKESEIRKMKKQRNNRDFNEDEWN